MADGQAPDTRDAAARAYAERMGDSWALMGGEAREYARRVVAEQEGEDGQG